MELAKKAESEQKKIESLLDYALMFAREAEASETVLNFTEAAWWRRGAAILYGMAGESAKSKAEWKLAADMFDMSVRAYYRDRIKEGFLSKEELAELIDIASDVLICCANMESFGAEGRKLIKKYSSIYMLAKKSIRGGHTQRPEPLLME